MKKTATNESTKQPLTKQLSKDSKTRLSKKASIESVLKPTRSNEGIEQSFEGSIKHQPSEDDKNISNEVVSKQTSLKEESKTTIKNKTIGSNTEHVVEDDQLIFIDNQIENPKTTIVEPEATSKQVFQIQEPNNDPHYVDFDTGNSTNNENQYDNTYDYFHANMPYTYTNDIAKQSNTKSQPITLTPPILSNPPKRPQIKNNKISQLTKRSSLNKINGMTHSQFIMKKDAQYIREYDELNYLEQKLVAIKADKESYKQQYVTLHMEADDLRAKIHKIKYNKDLDKHIRENTDTGDNLMLIKAINDEKRKREDKVIQRIEHGQMKYLADIKKLEEIENQKRTTLLAEKRNKMLENIENIRKRGEERKIKVASADRLVNDLLKSINHTAVIAKEVRAPLKVSNLYKF